MLTPEQRAIHRTGIGSSQIAALAGISPFASPMDVWMDLTGIVPEQDDSLVEDERDVGSIMEPAVLNVYAKRNGVEVRRHSNQTHRHPEHPWAIASPDATALSEPERLVEAKLVGIGMGAHWSDGTAPEYVQCQAHWQLFVFGIHRRIERCDVAAVVEGTRYVQDRVERDDRTMRALFELAQWFWHDHVLTKIPPPSRDEEERLAYLAKRYLTHRDEILDIPESEAEFVRGLVAQWRAAKATLDAATAAEAAAQLPLCELVADAAGIRGDWGTFTWRAQRGRPSYQAIAQALAPNGTIPQALIEQHRGEDFRKPHFSPPKAERAAKKRAAKATRRTIIHVLGSAVSR